ncbi:hypothetical protein OROHE_027028 [Orobanche hederae]
MMRGSDSNGNLEIDATSQSELESLLLRQQQNRSLILERERDLDINRSGSAPPTVEGALDSAGSLLNHPGFAKNYESSGNNNSNTSATMTALSEDEIRSHPAYLEYYYSHENLNPRLPPPTLSKENWRAAQRIRAVFGLGVNLSDNGGSSSLFSMQPGLSVRKSEDDLIELRKAALINLSRKNSVESFEKRSNSTGSIGGSSSGMGVRRKSFADILQEGRGQPVKSNLSRPASQDSMGISKMESLEALLPEKTFTQNSSGSVNPSSLSSLASSRADNLNTTPALEAHNYHSPSIFEIADIAASLSGLSMSRGQLHTESIPKSSLQMNITRANEYPRRTSSTSNLLQSQRSPSDKTINHDCGAGSHLSGANGDRRLSRTSAPPGFPIPVVDPHQVQYLQKMPNHGTNLTHISGNFPHSHDDLRALERAYLEVLLLQRRQQYEALLSQKNGSINQQYTGNSAFSPSAASYQGNLVPNSQIPRVSSRSSVLQKEKSTPNLRSLKGESSGNGSSMKGRFESLLEVLKNNRTKSLELSDIIGYVVEFSTDQFGSRFIQQKLENATVEEKTKILMEIIPNARSLMTDVFGNYVIQKFFEHGTESQRKELAGHLIGHVLALTLQMYGCRVIQKALEVVDTELQTKMVAELDGSVIKCVYDQNGNHVIQKCIECVPQDRIQFIITPFLGQVVTLSTHPYGCRVIQRVLEHCDDPKTQEIIMCEIMSSVCKLAQDQYGNYVIQHVVQHGKQHERSAIISKLAGQIVKMSQQKFASNVIEKCLTFSGPEERQHLVNEMLGSTDENEPLQAMMKDPFGNYVVQKVLETCDEKSRELILSRIKVHLSALKRYTYGKHIVSRVEKLVAACERQRHIGHSSSNSY